MPSAAFKKALANVQKKAGDIVKDVNKAGVTKYVKTHSPCLNRVYGSGKGIAVGRIHRYMGPESGGKSTICTFVGREFQDELLPQLGLNKPYCIYLDFEGSFDRDHAVQMGLHIDEDRFIFMQPDDLESAAAACEELVKTGEIGTIIFDSESMSTTRTIQENELGKATFGNKAKVLGDFLVKFAILCRNYQTTMFIISQERANMALMSHAIVTTGGFALKYAASTLMRVKKIEDLKDENGEIAGIRMNIRNYKNKTAKPWREGNLDLWFDRGFDYFSEYVDLIKEYQNDERMTKLVKIGGAYYKSDEWDFSVCGRDKFVEWAKLPENAEKWKKITDTIDEISDGTLATDKETIDPELEGTAEEKELAKESIAIQNADDEKMLALVAADEQPEITLTGSE